jgi:hypothetical protein
LLVCVRGCVIGQPLSGGLGDLHVSALHDHRGALLLRKIERLELR